MHVRQEFGQQWRVSGEVRFDDEEERGGAVLSAHTSRSWWYKDSFCEGSGAETAWGMGYWDGRWPQGQGAGC